MTKSLLGGGAALLLALTLVGQAAAQTWTQLTPSGGPPAVRSHHSAVYDPATNQMIVFGGRGGDPSDIIFNDDWRLTDANGVGAPAWILVPPAGSIPAPRWVHRAVYDQANDRMIVFGGGLGRSSPCTNTVYVLTNASGAGGTPTWSFLIIGGPAPRFSHSVVYNPNSNKLIVFGGSNCFSAPSFNDLWVLSNANGLGGAPTWALLGQSGSAPGFLHAHTAVYDSANNRMIVFGGATPAILFNNNVRVLANADGTGGAPTWSLLAPSGTPPPARQNHTAVYDTAANEMIVFGGQAPGGVNDVWVLTGANGLGGTPTWVELFPSGGPPLARATTTAVFDQATKRMTVFGGGGSNLNDTWVLTVSVPPEEAIQNLIDDINSLPDAAFVKSNRRKPLVNKLNAVLGNIQAGDLGSICEAIDKLTNDILPKTDGESPPPDWVTDPTAQQQIEDEINIIITALQAEADLAGGCP